MSGDIEYIKYPDSSNGEMRAVSDVGKKLLQGYVRDNNGWVKFPHMPPIMDYFKRGGAVLEGYIIPNTDVVKPWEPWITFRTELPSAELDVAEPPCKHCARWAPRRWYESDKFVGVKMCHAERMHSDFSCYQPRA
jgi:hypothetical protein